MFRASRAARGASNETEDSLCSTGGSLLGRLAAEARTQTSRKSGEDYTVLRIAQNIRAVGSTVVTNYFNLVCFGGAHHIAKELTTGQEVYFRGTFIQEALERPGQPPRLLNKIVVDYLRAVAKSRPGAAPSDES